MSSMKICPDLITLSWEKSYVSYLGDYQQIHYNECIKEACAAYKENRCMKYGTIVNEVNNNVCNEDV